MKYLRVVIILTCVSVFSAGILSFTEQIFRNKILDNQKKAINEAITRIIPELDSIEKENDIYKIFNKEKILLGYIFLAEGQGYQGTIKIICGIAPDLEQLLGIEIIESTETPGLGAKIAGKDFKAQFINLKILPQISCTKSKPQDDNQIQAITGATISSKSVVNILNKRIDQIRNQIRKSDESGIQKRALE